MKNDYEQKLALSQQELAHKDSIIQDLSNLN